MLRAAWPGDGMLADVVQELAARVPGAECIAAYTRTADGGLGVCGQTAVRPYDSWKNWRGATDIPEHARYPLDRRDPWALTAADETEVWEGCPERLEAFRETVLEPNGLFRQLRVTLYDRSRLLGFFGIFRPRDGAPFAARDKAMLQQLVPDLRRVFGISQLLHGTGLRSGGVLAVLDALGAPAFLVTPRGDVVHANPSARARYPTAPEWLWTAPRRPRDVRHLATVHPVPVDGVPLFLVLARESSGTHPGLTSLPPSLARVGHLMARGLSDKEIAAELDLPLATARTYAQRVLRRLRLSDRRELMLQ